MSDVLPPLSSQAPRKKRKWLKRAALIVLTLLLLPVLAGAGGLAWLWFGLPRYDGQVHVPGLEAGVEVMRDLNAVPHIFAASENDAAYALGYTHAQDRLWQMDVLRRTGQGRLSEIFGATTLRYDRLLRTLGFYKAAQRALSAMSPDMQALLAAYADGVNAYLDTRHGPLPLEFQLLQYAPERWQPADSIVWGYLMALQLSGNYRAELLRARLAPLLGKDKLDDLYPPAPWDTTFTLETASLNWLAQLAEGLPGLPPSLEGRGASNEFVVDGRFTASGKPILANDPHLKLEAPGLWYLARISTPQGTRIGATVPGVPVVVLGQGDHVAWGFTTTGADLQDVFIETLDPEREGYYKAGAEFLPFTVREEVLKIRGAADEKMMVRETRHGPVISDLLDDALKPKNPQQVAALAFVPLTVPNTTIEAIWRMGLAADGDAFRAELQKNYVAPMQNVVYADTGGLIGFIAPGYVPVRKDGNGFMPSAGALASGAWQGPIPFSLLPQAEAPAQGLFYNANNAIVGLGYTYFISREWEDHYRAERLRQLLTALPQRDDFVPPRPPRAGTLGIAPVLLESETADDTLTIPELLARMTGRAEAPQPAAPAAAKTEPAEGLLTAARAFAVMGDIVDGTAAELLPLMLANVAAPDETLAAVVQRLRGWDGAMAASAPEPLIYTEWLRQLNIRLLSDELGSAFEPYFSWGLNARVLRRVLTIGRAWCDDVRSEATEGCPAQVTAALHDALDHLKAHYGGDFRHWRWGQAHVAPFNHPLLSHIPLLREMFDHSTPTDGGFYTLNRAAGDVADAQAPHANTHGAGYRAAYDLADRAQSRFMIATGQSGNPLSPYYMNLLSRWRQNESFPIAGSRDAVRARNIGILTLWPAEKP